MVYVDVSTGCVDRITGQEGNKASIMDIVPSVEICNGKIRKLSDDYIITKQRMRDLQLYIFNALKELQHIETKKVISITFPTGQMIKYAVAHVYDYRTDKELPVRALLKIEPFGTEYCDGLMRKRYY